MKIKTSLVKPEIRLLLTHWIEKVNPTTYVTQLFFEKEKQLIFREKKGGGVSTAV